MSSTTPQGNNLMSQLGSSALGALTGGISGAVGEGLGLLFQGANNNEQAAQQQRLTDIQLAANEQLSAYNYGQQLQLWQNTNYPAQVNELNQAGLNPALLYGSHGAGASATTGSPSGGIGLGIAPGTTPGQTAQLAMQNQETAADINLKNAQAENIKAQTPQEAGLMQAQTLNLTQGVQNQMAQQALTQVQTTAQQIQNTIQGQTQDDQIASIRAASSQMQQQFQIIQRNNWMDAQTLQTKIDQTNANLIQTFLQNNLTQSQTTLNQQQVQTQIQSVMQQWQQLGINKQNANTQEGQLKLNQFIHNLPDTLKLAGDALSRLIPNVIL